MQLYWNCLPDSTAWHGVALRASQDAPPLVDTLVQTLVDGALAEFRRRAAADAKVESTFASLDAPHWRRWCAQIAAVSASRGELAPTAEELRDAWGQVCRNVPQVSPNAIPNATAFEPFVTLAIQMLEVMPELGEQLTLRLRPFSELWEARGPGMLRHLFRSLGVDVKSPDRAYTIGLNWTLPLQGGGGWCEPHLHQIFMEAVLVNPFAPLPEPLRAGWLIAQAATAHSGEQPLDPTSLIPFVLAAGEYVEWTTCDVPRVAMALQAWMNWPAGDATAQAERLLAEHAARTESAS